MIRFNIKFIPNYSIRLLLLMQFLASFCYAQILPVIPDSLRGKIDQERMGTHDANKIRTMFYNFGMVGDYPPDPLNVDLSVFHSVEIPKGSGENYSDGTTPFVLANVMQGNGIPAYIMETGYRERQGVSPVTNKTMRFEPRPGYLQINPDINKGRSVAMSNDKRTWPDKWIDKLNDPDDPGWSGSWNGYFGKAPKADQESFVVYDDNFYDAWDFYSDNRDHTRRGFGLKIEQRGFQWSNPQAGFTIFFHYDISNESTTDYDNNVIFGLYMDSGVGGEGIGIDGFPESDDDNAFFDKSAGLNLVYTWDLYGHGVKGNTGYLGYAYMETPGNAFDGIDNDQDGITDESRDSGPGIKIVGQENILNYVNTHYDMAKFEKFYGPVKNRPAYIAGEWWTGDEDMDWVKEFDDTGADGVFGTHDIGENDGIPTEGEPNFDKTDIDESDQIGLTGFKMNRIRGPNAGSPVDAIVFYDDGREWPKRLYNLFTNPDSAYDPLQQVLGYNIAFLFASGPFQLKVGKTERFSLALAFGRDLTELRTTTKVVQQIYKANYQFSVPPPMPTLNAYAGNRFVTLNWDNAAERGFDPLTNSNDFEGYRIYRSTDPAFLDPQVIISGNGVDPIGNGKPLVQFDLVDNVSGYSQTSVEGVAYYLGNNTGITHTFTDTTVTNGQNYYYAVTSYNTGVDSIQIYPSENAIAVSQTLRGGTILPKNVVNVTPNPPVPGFVSADAVEILHNQGTGTGSINIQIKNPSIVPDNHDFQIEFYNHTDSVSADHYTLVDLNTKDTLFDFGNDFNAAGIGPNGGGVLPLIYTIPTVQIDSVNSGLTRVSNTNVNYKYRYSPSFPIGLIRPGFPENIDIIFSDVVQDTSQPAAGVPAIFSKFKIMAKTASGDEKLRFRFRNLDKSGLFDTPGDYIEVLTTFNNQEKATWKIEIDTAGLTGIVITPPSIGDIYKIRIKIPYSDKDKFSFTTKAQSVNVEKSLKDFSGQPYVVPNPYVGAASFEPQKFGVSGRGERKIEFRNIPINSIIRIFTLSGELVNTLNQNGNIEVGAVAWDLRNRDRLEVAPGLYIYHVDGHQAGTFVGKFAIIK